MRIVWTRKYTKIVALVIILTMILPNIVPVGVTLNAQQAKATAQVIADYNSSIGSGSPYLFGGGGKTPNKDQDKAWGTLQQDFGLGVVKVAIDLSTLFPTDENTMDRNVLSDYTHVAGSILSRANGANMKVMLEFINLPSWLDTDNDKFYDDKVKYETMLRTIYTEIYTTWNTSKDFIKFVEIVPDASLSADHFSDYYYETAAVIRSIDSNILIGGVGYELNGPSDSLSANVRRILNDFRDTLSYQNLLQYVSVRAYNVNLNNYQMDVFGEFKNGRKTIRNESGNANLPLFMTGWSTTAKGASEANNTITGVEGIQQQANALFKAMRDGWNLVLFDSMASDLENAGSYAYTIDETGEVTPNPFVRVYQLFNCLGLNKDEFKVISTDMGANWVVDDSIAMMNAKKEAIMFLSNFTSVKSNVTLELRNVPYEDGSVTVKTYVAADGQVAPSLDAPFHTIKGTVVNGNLNVTVPNIPVGAMGIIVTDGTERVLEAQSLYEFESQDNHFGGNTEITWTNGASFNRTVQGFGGENNFVTLQKVAADGTGTYTMKLYAANTNSNVMISVNHATPVQVNASSISLSNPVELDIELTAGNENTIKVYTTSGELKPDRAVLVAKDIQLSIGFQNLTTLEKEENQYILPLTKTDFRVDARVFPANAADGNTIQFASSNEACATIDATTGLITPIQEGETTITAQIKEEPSITASFNLKIKNTISSVTISPKSIVLLKGETATIRVNIQPENIVNKDIEWSMSAEGLEIVSKNNDEIVIRALEDTGAINVTAKAVEGGLSDSCLVTLNKLGDGGLVVSDFGTTTAVGHPEIFGITHYPSINPEDSDIGDHSEAWDLLKNTGGVRFMRADARLQEILPIWVKTPDTNWDKPVSGSYDPSIQPNYVVSELYYVTGPDGVERQFSIEGYREDMEHFNENGTYLNGMSNPDNWNTGRLLRWVRKAKETGLEVMVMTFQIPEWLASGYPASGAPHTEKACNSAPKDWDIYRDIVKKVYKLMKDEGVDYYEFLNEPHWYVPKGGDQRDPDGNAYTGSGANFANAVAADQFYQAIDAIYEYERETTKNPMAEPEMLLGGGADDSWGGDYGVLGKILSDKYQDWIERIDFISIHKYGERPANQDNSNNGANARNLKHWLKEKTGRNISLFLNEYNISTGQPTDETYGVKSLGWHTKNLIDMMIDEFSGGGYYTCYPADVPMDDYEASSGWVERGKGMYTWNDGEPYLATFTKAWDLMSRKLGLGDGEFLVKSIDISNSQVTQGVAAVNMAGMPVVVLNNYANSLYGTTTIKLNNLPFEPGTQVSAHIYNMNSSTPVEEEPIIKQIIIDETGSAELIVDRVLSYGVTGILLDGSVIQKNDKTYEMESYLNQFNGTAKINVETNASNGRWVINTNGEINSIEIPITFDVRGNKEISIAYASSTDEQLYYRVNDGEKQTVDLPASASIETVTITVPCLSGNNKIKFYTSNAAVNLDKVDIIREIPSDCTCELSQVILQDEEIQIPANENSKQHILNAQASLSGECEVEDHVNQQITYDYQIIEDNNNIANLSGNQLTVSNIGIVKVKVVASVNDLTSETTATYTVTKATVEPTATPTVEPTAQPTAKPTVEPTATPTVEPTATPTVEPTATPTVEPTAKPTVEPTAKPTVEPTAKPIQPPVTVPTNSPTESTKEPEQPTQSPDNVVIEEDESTKTETTTTIVKEDHKTITQKKTEVTDKKTDTVTETTVRKEETNEGDIKVNVTRKGTDVTIAAEVGVNDNKEMVSSNVKVTSSKTETKINTNKAEVKVAVSDFVIKEVVDTLAKQLGVSLNALEVEILIPEMEVVKQLNNNAVDTVVSTISIPKENTIYKVTNIILPAASILTAKDLNKNLKAEIRDSENKFLATWSFKKNALSHSESVIHDMDLSLNVSKVSDVSKENVISDIMENDKNNTKEKSILLSFGNDKTLPVATTINLAVTKDKNVKAGDKLYLYVVNDKTKKLEAIPNNEYVVSRAGNVAIQIIKGSDYVLLPKKPNLSIGVPLVNQVEVTLNGKSENSTSVVKTGKQISFELELPVTLRQVTEFSKKMEHKAISEVKISYQSSNLEVATVTKDGVITSKKKGKTTITTTIALREGKKRVMETVVTVK